jgi:hypothetical protein
MSYDWGPHYIVPSSVIEAYSGIVQLREGYDDEPLHQDLRELGISSPVSRVVNPWYYRKKGSPTWIKIGESEDREGNFWVTWDSRTLENGKYEVMGMMHVHTGTEGDTSVIARQNIVEITVRN